VGDGITCADFDACTPNPCPAAAACTDLPPPSTAYTCAPASVLAPTVVVFAAPSTITEGTSTTITWSSTDSTSCSSPGGGGTGVTGSFGTPALASNTTYTVTCTGPGGSKSASTTVTVNAGSCATTGGTSAISLSSVPSRLIGVAPLSVFFDATSTTATATSHPFHELEYVWDFGDPLGSPVSGTTWTTGSRPNDSSRNSARGPVAAHVFERPGTYTVSLTITDGTNSVSNTCTQIEVQDPDVVFASANTICVAASSLPVAGVGGCPVGASVAQQADFSIAISSYATTGNRVLFKRDDIFPTVTSAVITATGPGTLGAFGAGASPIVSMTGNAAALQLSSSTTPTFRDWRVMDLDFDGNSTGSSSGVGAGGGSTDVTILRVAVRNVNTSFGFGPDEINYFNNNGHPGHKTDRLFIVDSSTIPDATTTTYSSYSAGNRVAFMGNSFDNGGRQGGGSHINRFPYLNLAVISNNDYIRPGNDRLAIKLHAPFWGGGVPDATRNVGSNYSADAQGDGYTKYVLIDSNSFTAHMGPWMLGLSPQDSAEDERLHDLIVERNVFHEASYSQAAMRLACRQVTVRNNIYMGGVSDIQGLVLIWRDGGEPTLEDALTRVHKLASAHVSPCEVAQAVIWPRPRRRTR